LSSRGERPGRGDQRSAEEGSAEERSADEPFLSRWSRRKQASREQSSEPAVAPDEGTAAHPLVETQAAVEPAGHTEEGPPRDEPPELPPLESLTEESDFSAFMHAAVDPALRRLALRKMWGNPKYGIVDSLDPFRADFAAFTPLGDIVTSDMKFHAERLLRKELEKAAEAAEAAGTAATDSDQGDAGEGSGERGADATGEPEAGTARADDPQNNETEDDDERRDA
jgi:hypothetical protein